MSGSARHGILRQARLAWPPLIALTAVLVIAVVAVIPTGPLKDGGVVVASKQLRFVTTRTGAMDVIDAGTGREIGSVPSVKDGFVPGMIQGMTIIRKHYAVDQGLPYCITEMSDGRVLLIDPPTKSNIDLESFGRINAARFASYLHAPHPHVAEQETR